MIWSAATSRRLPKALTSQRTANMRSILITGGAGFIGSHLVNRLLSEGGWQITVVDDFNDFYDPAIKRAAVEPHLSNPDFKLIEADIRHYEALTQAFAGSRLDCIVQLAARP